MTAICGMISWFCILWTYTRWHAGLKKQGIDRTTLPYLAPLQPYLSYYGMSVTVMVMIFGGFTAFGETQLLFPCTLTRLTLSILVPKFDVSSFITTYFPIPFFAVLFFGYKLFKKSKMVAFEDMDFTTGSSMEMPCEVSFPHCEMRR